MPSDDVVTERPSQYLFNKIYCSLLVRTVNVYTLRPGDCGLVSQVIHMRYTYTRNQGSVSGKRAEPASLDWVGVGGLGLGGGRLYCPYTVVETSFAF